MEDEPEYSADYAGALVEALEAGCGGKEIDAQFQHALDKRPAGCFIQCPRPALGRPFVARAAQAERDTFMPVDLRSGHIPTAKPPQPGETEDLGEATPPQIPPARNSCYLLMTDDRMRHIRLFQVCDLFLGQFYGQSADGIFQMRDLRCTNDRRRYWLFL
jgi:hypothetical protein